MTYLLSSSKMITNWILATALLAALQLVAVSAQADTEGGMYEGDIMLTPEQQSTLEATANPNDPFSPQQAVVRNPRALWPNAVVPYIIDSSLGTNTRARDAIQQAIDEYKLRSCVNFVPRSNEADYVRFYRGNGCFSFIGRVSGPQDISIGQGCEFKGIVMHEMFHALGRWHEQSRPDRDMYVRINTANIQSGTENNFEITPSTFVTTQGIPYDLGSVMHYGAFAFSRNRQPTIEPIDPNTPLSALGQRNGFSPSDIQHVNTLYCGGAPTGSWSSWGSWSSCSRTCNGGTRSRTRTCQGGTDCEGSNIDRQNCNTQSCPVAATWGSWGSWSSCSASCGGGRQQRLRRCVGGNTCVGASSQFRDCNTQSCPQPATWGAWGSWSACSSTCQGGIRQRTRRCLNGNTCPGAGFQSEFCNSDVSCTSQPNPNSGEWGQWSQCTRSCGGGVRFRTRMCGTTNCPFQQQDCNTQDCNPEPDLRGLQHVGCYFFPGYRRLRLLEGTTTDLSDNPRTRTNPIGKCGAGAQASDYRIFSISTGYCISGSNRLSDYQYVQNTYCQNGVGGTVRSVNGNLYYVMDVYQIQDPQVFLDSVSQVATTTDTSTTTESSDEAGADLSVDNGVPVIKTSLTVLLTLALVTLICILLQ